MGDIFDNEASSIGNSIAELAESSEDEEPLAQVRRRVKDKFIVPAAVMQPSLIFLGEGRYSEDPMQVDTPHDTSTISASEEVKSTRPHRQQTAVVRTRKPESAPAVDVHADAADYSARSLFDEWPEYDPKNGFDKAVKLAEIKMRPSRKEMFGKPAMYSRLASNESAKPLRDPGVSAASSLRGSAERINKPARRVPDSDAFSLEENVHHCDTLEEFFGLPDNPIPFIDKGQLVYRDGTRGEDGVLPRVKYKYPTGPG